MNLLILWKYNNLKEIPLLKDLKIDTKINKDMMTLNKMDQGMIE